MNPSQAGLMQMQLRNNATDLESYLTDLQSWEDEIKEKDKTLSKQKPILKEDLPPIRSKAASSGERRRKKKKEVSQVQKKTAPGQPRIRSYDYGAWDKFNVEKACEDVDYQVQSSSSSSDSESSEEMEEEERKRQQAVIEKEKGNSHFKQGQYSLAEESYTKAMELDPLNAVLPANRAMVCLKLQRYSDAEKDCSLALALDDTYVKAYFRRATARVKLGKLKEAKLDYEAMLRYEPGNKQAKLDLAKLEEKLKEQVIKEGFVFPVKRLPHLRSKKPLKRRVHIEDIGAVEDTPTGEGRQSGDRDRVTGNKEAQPTSSTVTMVTESQSTETRNSSLEIKAGLGEEAKLSKPSVQSSHSTKMKR